MVPAATDSAIRPTSVNLRLTDGGIQAGDITLALSAGTLSGDNYSLDIAGSLTINGNVQGNPGRPGRQVLLTFRAGNQLSIHAPDTVSLQGDADKSGNISLIGGTGVDIKAGSSIDMTQKVEVINLPLLATM